MVLRRTGFVGGFVALAVLTGSGLGQACEPVPIGQVPSALAATVAAIAAATPAADRAAATDTAVPVARCGPGSRPEPGVQGEVSAAARADGRALQSFQCNLVQVGHFQGQGASWVNPSYGHCAYMSTHFGDLTSPGVQVLDVSDSAHPRLTAVLRSPAMLATWESLKVNPQRGLLAAVNAIGPAGNGLAFFDVYDIKTDCAHPRLLDAISSTQLTLPANAIGHEGLWSPDGRTYWATGQATLTAIDVSDPAHPRPLLVTSVAHLMHGMGISPDGNTLYMAESGNIFTGFSGITEPAVLGDRNGLKIVDISDVQARRPHPHLRALGALYWADGAAAQMAVPMTYAGHPYVLFTDELLYGAARIIDVADPHHPRLVSKLKLQIQLPQSAALRAADAGRSDVFEYNAHYCSVDRPVNPTAAACGYFESGIRVFDIRNPVKPREIAYFHPPAQSSVKASLEGSEHANLYGALGPLTADWCSSPPTFVGNQLWVTCQDDGFLTLRFTNHVYPLPSPPLTKKKTARRTRHKHAAVLASATTRSGPPEQIGLSPTSVLLLVAAAAQQSTPTAATASGGSLSRAVRALVAAVAALIVLVAARRRRRDPARDHHIAPRGEPTTA